jgi:hypothetical protein
MRTDLANDDDDSDDEDDALDNFQEDVTSGLADLEVDDEVGDGPAVIDECVGPIPLEGNDLKKILPKVGLPSGNFLHRLRN